MTREELLELIDRAADEGWTELDLSGKGLTELPAKIGKLTQLETLILGKWDQEKEEWVGNQLTDLPNAIAQLTNLTRLDLSCNQISTIPESIVQLTNLTVLNLMSNQISVIPESIVQLRNLTKLNLWGNQISAIPESIAQFTNLTELYLSSNQISVIPESIARLTGLTELSLSSNQISVIPESIAQLTNLTELYLHINQISVIPESIAQLTNLMVLSLSLNQITAIPDAIAQLTNLTMLSLWSNQIRAIPNSIAQLTNLTGLALANNQIKEIPQATAQLTNLTVLHLLNNQIKEIPNAIAQLTNLTELNLANNHIQVLPNFLENLPNLKKLDLRCNPLPISPEVLGSPNLDDDPGSVEDIFNYCRQLRSGKVRPLNEAKLLLVGQGSVGKTSLIERLLHDRYNPHQPQTDGLSVKTWNIHVNSKDIRLNVWDFGGQEIYHATHQFFLTKRSLYLLVCDCRISEDQNRIEYWLKLIESFGDQSPVIIVGNKKDEQPLDINRKALRDKYPNIKAILETSCETNDGIDALRTAITQEIAQLREVYNLLPLSWFEVKQHLEALDQDCISYSKYACICEAQAIDSEADQQQLIGLLHNLGLVLNFREHPILQNTNVLKPDWVTQGIYALLSDETLKTVTKGILTPADLSRILDGDRYPPNRHSYLTELMQEFQLCFPLGIAHTYLIPGLLPKEEPADTALEGDTLDFQYHYRILPESIISRFIVLTHDKIHQHTYWRSGVMLAYTEGGAYNIARIKADPEDKKIFISISGRETTRRSFLFLIRDTFQKIHRSFANPDISEWVPVPGHPDHPPLDYQELLGLEEMGEQNYPIGKLRIKVNLRQLLDGYESIEARQRKRMGDHGEAFEQHFHHYGDVIQGDKVGNDKVGNDKIGRDKTG